MSESPLDTGRAVLADVLSCPIRLTEVNHSALVDFQEEACLDPRLQPAFTATYLREFVRQMEPQVVHELLEPLGMAAMLLRWDDSLLIIGPYSHEPLLPGMAEEIIARLGIPSIQLQPYKLHRTRFPIVDSGSAHRGAVSLLRLAGKEDPLGSLRRVRSEVEAITPGFGEPPHSASLEVIDERYANERAFMDAVADGSAERALEALQRLSNMSKVQNYMTTPFLGATILRIMARVAAQRGGLAPITIDAISQDYAQRLHRMGHSKNSKHTVGLTGQMVEDFCRQVQRHRQRPFSQLVRRAVEEIDLHLSHQVSTPELAERFGVSTSTLARRFKTETGKTVATYVAAQRAERAARLLTTTNQSIRDVALFVGYEDANYFVKVFRAAHGMTPTAYRGARAT